MRLETEGHLGKKMPSVFKGIAFVHELQSIVPLNINSVCIAFLGRIPTVPSFHAFLIHLSRLSGPLKGGISFEGWVLELQAFNAK